MGFSLRRPGRPDADRRRSTTTHYETFNTPPPKSKGQPPSTSPSSQDHNGHLRRPSDGSQPDSPLPKRQLAILAVIALCEQTALNSIGPYLPQMTSSFPEVQVSQVGIYVGTIASSFALAQFATGFLWGWISDRIGRKPVILTGTLLTAACFIAFGFCRTLWQAVVVQVFMGLVNGNQGVVSTCLGEITDRSNQSKAFVYLPVIYGLGGITGPIVGGLLVPRQTHFSKENPYPYLPPNLLSAGVLLIDLILTMIFLEESLDQAKNLPPLGKRMRSLFSWAWQFSSSSRPSYTRLGQSDGETDRYLNGALDGADDDSADDSGSEHSMPHLIPDHGTTLTRREVLHRDTILLLASYLIFQLSNISYNSLYPIFGQARPPTGRSLSPEEIGFSLAFAGATTIIFQIAIFGKLRDRMGNRVTYRVCFFGMVVAYFLTPFVGYKKKQENLVAISIGKAWLYIELGVVLLIRSVASVGCLTSALLLVSPLSQTNPSYQSDPHVFSQITNSAPNNSVLGTLNGLAQTLSAAGRAIGPFLAGGLFSLGTRVKPKGEALAFGVFGGVAFVGFLSSFGIRDQGLESGGWDEEGGDCDEGDTCTDDDDDEDDQEGDGDAEGGTRVERQASST